MDIPIPIAVGDYILAGHTTSRDPDDWDAGQVVAFADGTATVAWDRGETTDVPIDGLVVTTEKSDDYRRSEIMEAATRAARQASVSAWPCEESGDPGGDGYPARDVDHAHSILGSFPFGGHVRYQRGQDVTWDWGFGEAPTPLEAVALMDQEDLDDDRHITRWFRVIGAGLNGSVARTPGGAWTSFYLKARLEYGYGPHDQDTACAAHSAQLVVGTTRRAAEDADVSEAYGTVGGGEWWRAPWDIEHEA